LGEEGSQNAQDSPDCWKRRFLSQENYIPGGRARKGGGSAYRQTAEDGGRAQYAAVFEWVYNTKRITGEFVRALLGLRVVTNPGT
jgi:hypothetical protein